jgi:hypothetical protein
MSDVKRMYVRDDSPFKGLLTAPNRGQGCWLNAWFTKDGILALAKSVDEDQVFASKVAAKLKELGKTVKVGANSFDIDLVTMALPFWGYRVAHGMVPGKWNAHGFFCPAEHGIRSIMRTYKCLDAFIRDFKAIKATSGTLKGIGFGISKGGIVLDLSGSFFCDSKAGFAGIVAPKTYFGGEALEPEKVMIKKLDSEGGDFDYDRAAEILVLKSILGSGAVDVISEVSKRLRAADNALKVKETKEVEKSEAEAEFHDAKGEVADAAEGAVDEFDVIGDPEDNSVADTSALGEAVESAISESLPEMQG